MPECVTICMYAARPLWRTLMKGTVQTKTTKKGIEYLYIYLDYTDPITHKWKQKAVSTGLEAKGNKRRAEKMIQE